MSSGRRTGLLVAVVVVAALSACSRVSRVRLFNATGGTILVKLEPDWVWEPRTARLGAGAARTFTGGHLEGVLVAGGCAYGYIGAYPAMIPPDGFRGAKNGLAKIQVQPDFSLAVLPPTARATMPPDQLALAQGEGFPLKPVSTICDGPKPPA